MSTSFAQIFVIHTAKSRSLFLFDIHEQERIDAYRIYTSSTLPAGGQTENRLCGKSIDQVYSA